MKMAEFFLSYKNLALSLFFFLLSVMNISQEQSNSADLYAKANDAFFDDDYDEALTLFTELVTLEPINAEFILKR